MFDSINFDGKILTNKFYSYTPLYVTIRVIPIAGDSRITSAQSERPLSDAKIAT
jgi:hypothetical protein